MRQSLKFFFLVFLSITGLFVSAFVPPSAKVGKKDLEQVFGLMSGTFSSEAQSKADSSFFAISLKMRPIWKQSATEKWLYVEQAMSSKPDKPYRQRIYHLQLAGDTAILSTVYELPRPERFIGAVQEPERLNVLRFDSLIARPGCAIVLKKNGEQQFAGSTPGKQCLSSLRGATYATSVVQIGPKGLISWDQGWDASDKQVWGAVKGGYQFDKIGNW